MNQQVEINFKNRCTFPRPYGLGGLAVIFMGRIADIWGLSTAITIIFLLPLLAGLIALLMKSHPAGRSVRL